MSVRTAYSTKYTVVQYPTYIAPVWSTKFYCMALLAAKCWTSMRRPLPLLTCYTFMLSGAPHCATRQFSYRATPLALCSTESPDSRVEHLVNDLARLVVEHEQRPWNIRELHDQLEQLTAIAAAGLPSKAADNRIDIIQPTTATRTTHAGIAAVHSDISALTVAKLREELGELGLCTSGLKKALQQRLAEARLSSSANHNDVATREDTPHGPGQATSRGTDDLGWLIEMNVSSPARMAIKRLVSKKQKAGPQKGVFTDGSCVPNPGPGGWAALRVDGNRVLWARCGRETRATTNNRMELIAVGDPRFARQVCASLPCDPRGRHSFVARTSNPLLPAINVRPSALNGPLLFLLSRAQQRASLYVGTAAPLRSCHYLSCTVLCLLCRSFCRHRRLSRHLANFLLIQRRRSTLTRISACVHLTFGRKCGRIGGGRSQVARRQRT